VQNSGYTLDNPVNETDPLGLKCKKGYWERVGENFTTTNKAIPGLFAPPLMGVITGGKMAEGLGTTTFARWGLSGFRGATLSGATFTGAETGILAGATAAINFVGVAVAWETGVTVGSMISAAIMPCEEEPTPCECE